MCHLVQPSGAVSRVDLTSAFAETAVTVRKTITMSFFVHSRQERAFATGLPFSYRLHRIEERTGRSLSRPRDLAELCFAFEVHRLLL